MGIFFSGLGVLVALAVTSRWKRSDRRKRREFVWWTAGGFAITFLLLSARCGLR